MKKKLDLFPKYKREYVYVCKECFEKRFTRQLTIFDYTSVIPSTCIICKKTKKKMLFVDDYNLAKTRKGRY